MISITGHIEYLMSRHDCVAIPGWGAFIANYCNARYDQEREVMEHPCRTLGFNASVDHNDGLLVHSIMRREGMDYDAAMRFIADTVTAFRQQVDMGCEVSMGRLGYFKPNHGIAEFVPFNNSYGYDAYYGLDDLPLKTVAALERQQAAQEEQERHRADVVPAGSNPFVRRAVKIAASVAVLIGLGVMLTTPIVVDRSHQQLASMAPAVSAPRPQQLGVTVEPGVVAQPVTSAEQPQQPSLAGVGNDDGHYYMVIATLRNDQELAAFKNKYPQLVPLMKLLDYKGMMCVYVARSDDYNTLMDLRDQLPEPLRDVWIYS